jgi:hypothetical protein
MLGSTDPDAPARTGTNGDHPSGTTPSALSGIVLLTSDISRSTARTTAVDLAMRPDLLALLADEDDIYARAGWSATRPSVSPDALLRVLAGVPVVVVTAGQDLVAVATGRCLDALGLPPAS